MHQAKKKTIKKFLKSEERNHDDGECFNRHDFQMKYKNIKLSLIELAKA